MIISKQKNPDEILKMLEAKKKIFIIGCGDCAATCKTGGEDDVLKMAEFLKVHGKTVTGTVVPEVTCVSAQAKIAFAKNMPALKDSQVILVLACGSGVQCVRDNDRLKLDVVPGCDTLFAALIDKEGSFKEVCSACGDCILEVTDGICPATRCPKGILNGPCGGQNKGKCEVDSNRDCAWILIYNRLKEKGKQAQLKKRMPARNYAKMVKPGIVILP